MQAVIFGCFLSWKYRSNQSRTNDQWENFYETLKKNTDNDKYKLKKAKLNKRNEEITSRISSLYVAIFKSVIEVLP